MINNPWCCFSCCCLCASASSLCAPCTQATTLMLQTPIHPQFWVAGVMLFGDVVASPEAFAGLPSTPPPGIPEDTLPAAPLILPPWNVSGPSSLYSGFNNGRPICNLSYSAAPLFRAVPLPPHSPYSIYNPNLATDPINLLFGRLTFTGLASAPLSGAEGAAVSALPLWALSLAPGEADPSKRCAGTG